MIVQLTKDEECRCNVTVTFREREQPVEWFSSEVRTETFISDGLTVSLTFAASGDKIVPLHGRITVRDDLIDHRYEDAVGLAAQLLDLNTVEFMRQVWAAGLNAPWKHEITDPITLSEWRIIALGGEVVLVREQSSGDSLREPADGLLDGFPLH